MPQFYKFIVIGALIGGAIETLFFGKNKKVEKIIEKKVLTKNENSDTTGTINASETDELEIQPKKAVKSEKE